MNAEPLEQAHHVMLRCDYTEYLHFTALDDAHSQLRSERQSVLDSSISGDNELTHRLLAPVGVFSIFLTANIPSITRPNTTCLPSRKSAGAVVMKN